MFIAPHIYLIQGYIFSPWHLRQKTYLCWKNKGIKVNFFKEKKIGKIKKASMEQENSYPKKL